jgi:yecA family protein
MKLLVADDSLFYRNMLQCLLESWGYEVVLATNGHEAQSILDSGDSPRLAILDYLMPGVGGLELCEQIRRRKQGYVYTILLIAEHKKSELLRAFELGADDYLCKPFDQNELRTRLKVGERIIRSYGELVETRKALQFEASLDSLLQIRNRRAIIELVGKEPSLTERSHMLTLPHPLTDDELDHLDDILGRVNPGETMSLEELDGFFCALICSPEVVPPSEYMPHIFGSELVQGRWVSTMEKEQELMNLLSRHWNAIATTLLRDEPHAVLIGEYGNDSMTGLDWARGFELGMSLRDDSWNRLINDDQFAIALVPIVALAEANNPDSGLPPMTPEVQEKAVRALGASVLIVYRYFRVVARIGNVTADWQRQRQAYTLRMAQ